MTDDAANAELPLQPESVGRYRIEALLGRGAMGIVYRARDTVLDREVALKLMAAGRISDPNFRARFEREARIVARISHPNVVVAYDLGYHTDGSPFIAMELLSGQDLANLLRTFPPDADDSAAIALQVLAGLARAHDRGIVHRDVKPANVFVTEDGKVKVMDFGVARLTTAAVTATGAVIGTAHYMSPEQVRGGDVDGRSDVFAVGCVLYEMLAGRRPFEAGDMVGILFQIVSAEPDFSLIPPAAQALAPMLRRAMQKDPAERYGTALEGAAGPSARELHRRTGSHGGPDGNGPDPAAPNESGRRESDPGRRESDPGPRESSPGPRESSPTPNEPSPRDSGLQRRGPACRQNRRRRGPRSGGHRRAVVVARARRSAAGTLSGPDGDRQRGATGRAAGADARRRRSAHDDDRSLVGRRGPTGPQHGSSPARTTPRDRSASRAAAGARACAHRITG